MRPNRELRPSNKHKLFCFPLNLKPIILWFLNSEMKNQISLVGDLKAAVANKVHSRQKQKNKVPCNPRLKFDFFKQLKKIILATQLACMLPLLVDRNWEVYEKHAAILREVCRESY